MIPLCIDRAIKLVEVGNFGRAWWQRQKSWPKEHNVKICPKTLSISSKVSEIRQQIVAIHSLQTLKVNRNWKWKKICSHPDIMTQKSKTNGIFFFFFLGSENEPMKRFLTKCYFKRWLQQQKIIFSNICTTYLTMLELFECQWE